MSAYGADDKLGMSKSMTGFDMFCKFRSLRRNKAHKIWHNLKPDVQQRYHQSAEMQNKQQKDDIEEFSSSAEGKRCNRILTRLHVSQKLRQAEEKHLGQDVPPKRPRSSFEVFSDVFRVSTTADNGRRLSEIEVDVIKAQKWQQLLSLIHI